MSKISERELRDARIDYLIDFVEYFECKNRAKNDGTCSFSPSKSSEGCAIGRKITDKELCAILDFRIKEGGMDLCDAFEMYPAELQYLGKEFLSSIQELHDNERNWVKDKFLTQIGLFSLKAIIHVFNLDSTKLEKVISDKVKRFKEEKKYVEFTNKISIEAYNLLKGIDEKKVFAEYRDLRYSNLEEFLTISGSRLDLSEEERTKYYMSRNCGGTVKLIYELAEFGLVDSNDDSWHMTYVITEKGINFLDNVKS